MLRTIKAVVEPDGTVRLLEPVSITGTRRALLTILDEGDEEIASSGALLSESALAVDWSRPEEDAAWAFLQREQ